MDSDHFDRLVQALGRGRSRRGVLGVLAALLLAPAVSAGPQTESCLGTGKPCSSPETKQGLRTQGKGHRKHHLRSCSNCCTRKSTVGKDGKARCTCKGEGERCTNPAQCCGGQCRSGGCTSCPGETVFCDGSCVDLQTNDRHCGSCETPCGEATPVCENGICSCTATSCSSGQTCFEGQCGQIGQLYDCVCTNGIRGIGCQSVACDADTLAAVCQDVCSVNGTTPDMSQSSCTQTCLL
jgi:hypothetical protein